MDEPLPVKDFAKLLKLDTATVYKAINQGRVKAELRFGLLVIPRREIQRFKKRKNGSQKKVLKAA